MTADEPLRRLFPPPRRRPGVLELVVRWRVEIALGAMVLLVVRLVGAAAFSLLAAVIALLVALVPPVRLVAVGLLLAVVTPHRVRSGLVQAGVTDRSGRLPWLVFARYHGNVVMVRVWLRSGTTPEDLQRAAPLIRSACGASDVEVARLSPRYDRAVVIVARPRWGWPGR